MSPGAWGANSFGHLDAAEFPVMASFFLFAFVYGVACVCYLVLIILQRAFAGSLHYLFLLTIILDFSHSYLSYKVLMWENEGVKGIVTYLL